MSPPTISDLLETAIAARGAFLEGEHNAAIRIFNGFTEGCPELVLDLYGATLIFNNYSEPPQTGQTQIREAEGLVRKRLPWLQTGVLKDRKSPTADQQRGRLVFGGPPEAQIREYGVWYAIDLMLSRDASFYMDTRNLRDWMRRSLDGKTVLNAFAYTGSLGVAAAFGGARGVVHLDRNGKFLSLAKRSYALNGLHPGESDFIQADFFRVAGRFRREGRRFDCVVIDPPFFAAGPTGKVDQEHESARLINKARPLVEDGGFLVAINNALYVSGKDYMETLHALCADGYLHLEEVVAVPDDCVGFGPGRYPPSVADPDPFNHPTKIAILKVKRK